MPILSSPVLHHIVLDDTNILLHSNLIYKVHGTLSIVIAKKLKNLFAFLSLIFLAYSCGPSTKSKPKTAEAEVVIKEKQYPRVGSIGRLDNALDHIISKNAVIEVLGSGMVCAEGPLWIPEKQWVLCSDVKESRIHKWTASEGFTVFFERTGFTGKETDSREKGSNGLILVAAGDLVMCHHGDRRIAKLVNVWNNPIPKFETFADKFEGKKLNSPYDLIYDSKGNLYFADPPFGLSEAMMEATPLAGKEKGVPDGVTVDKHGNVFTAGPGGLWIFNSTGKLLGKVRPKEWVSNCTFDETGKTLYITADDFLMRVKL